MKSTMIFAVLLAFTLANSCSNGSAASSPGMAAVGGPGSATSGTDAVFSYTLQGKKIAGGPTDATQTSNMAYIEKSGSVTNMQFFLNDAYDDNSSAFAHSLRFAIPAKTGTTQLGSDQDNGHVELFISKGTDGGYVVYGNETFTVTVTDITSTRVSGTFSGKVKSVSSAAEELSIADGKFEIPLDKTAK